MRLDAWHAHACREHVIIVGREHGHVATNVRDVWHAHARRGHEECAEGQHGHASVDHATRQEIAR